jgi:SAM-dependent methyltransferase
MTSNFLARHYNAMTGFPSRIDNLAKSIEPWVREWNVKSALDAGCGGGALMFALDRLNVEAVGLDLNESMLRLAMDNAREAGKSFRFHGAPFRSASAIFSSRFEAVFVLGNALIGHESDADMIESLRALHVTLKPGGHILIQNLNLTPFALGLKTVINRRVDGDTRYLRYAVPMDSGHLFFSVIADGPGDAIDISTHIWTVWSRERLQSCVEAAGFNQIEVYGGINRSPYDPRTSTDLVISGIK